MLPRVVLHNLVSVDGRMDWIGGDIGLYYELAARWEPDAMLSGSNTILAAFASQESTGSEQADAEPPTPALDDRRPLLAIVDSRGRVHQWSQIRRQPFWRDAVALCSQATPASYLDYLRGQQIDSIVVGEDQVDLRAALEELNTRYGARVVRVDSGGILNGALLRAGLVDEISILIDPSLVGGTTPRSIFIAPDLSSPDGLIPVRLTHVENVKDNIVWVRYEVAR